MKKLTNHVALVLDSSGSMDAFRNDVVRSFNSTVDAVRAGALKEKQVTTVSFWTFGESGYRVKQKFHNKPVDTLKALALHEYQPIGMTALLDAVGEAIETLSLLPDAKSKDTSFLLIVKTDGAENDSRNYSAAQLRALMQKVNATDRWTIAFLLPPGAKRNFCETFSIPEGNVREWEGSTRGVEEARVATQSGIGSYFASRSLGVSATKSFYQTDLSKVKPTQVRKALDDIAGDVKIWNVPSEVQISEFVEKKTRKPYAKGTAFYQLTKPELVQENKEILVMEKGKTAVYGGDDARQVLGIPEGRVKITPGNHATFDVFVQSTSVNRKLVRGSKIVVRV